MTAPEQVGVVVNPTSGDGNGEQLFDELARIFRTASLGRYVTSGPGEVVDATWEQADGSDLIVVIGGDGTIQEAASALADVDESPPLFVVPAGRGNSTYRHLYGEVNWRVIARGLRTELEGEPLEVGEIETEPAIEREHFVLGFTGGLFYGAVKHAERFTLLPGRLGYILGAGVTVLAGDPVTASVSVDGTELHSGKSRLVAVGGGRFRGSDFELFPDSRPGDGLLHGTVAAPDNLSEVIAIARSAHDGSLLDQQAVSHQSGETVVIESTDGLPVEVDGTPIDRPITRAELTVIPEALTYATPGAGGGSD